MTRYTQTDSYTLTCRTQTDHHTLTHHTQNDRCTLTRHTQTDPCTLTSDSGMVLSVLALFAGPQADGLVVSDHCCLDGLYHFHLLPGDVGACRGRYVTDQGRLIEGTHSIIVTFTQGHTWTLKEPLVTGHKLLIVILKVQQSLQVQGGVGEDHGQWGDILCPGGKS